MIGKDKIKKIYDKCYIKMSRYNFTGDLSFMLQYGHIVEKILEKIDEENERVNYMQIKSKEGN